MAAATLSFLAGSAQATTFHNKDQAYTINIAHDDGSTSYVGPGSSVEVADGWAYLRACQQQKGGDYFYCPPGTLEWPSWYGDVYFYLGDLTEASGQSTGKVT
ncbi:hypothetical protein FE257_003032 [Aspergillus nanangensis]|uniref:Uncharacterized protein n=1 Tax=Aspergillus nanangensis TaxID=2582783 RepID=A0AAD4GN20_ASPNN|nr:hypothetical protein FE257_003032 [Aspergillus nanangensis]